MARTKPKKFHLGVAPAPHPSERYRKLWILLDCAQYSMKEIVASSSNLKSQKHAEALREFRKRCAEMVRELNNITPKELMK